MKITRLEKDILKWISDHAGDRSLSIQCASVTVRDRKYTGAGFYTELEVSQELPKCDFKEAPVDPYIDSDELEDGGGCVLFLKNGYLDYLEIFSYGNEFPEEIGTYKLVEKENV